MDKYKLSGNDLRDFYQSSRTLSEVFTDIEKDLEAEKKVVCRFIVNNHVLDEGGEKKFADMDLKQIETLEFWADQLDNLVPDLIKNWKAAMPGLLAQCDEVSANIRFKGIQGQLYSAHQLLENCEFLMHSLISLRNVLGDSIIAQFMNWDEAHGQMQRLVREAMGAIEKKDFVLLADVLEFDLGHNLGLWLNFLNFAEKQIQSSESGFRQGEGKKSDREFGSTSSCLLSKSQKLI